MANTTLIDTEQPLDHDEDAAWRGLQRMQAPVAARLKRELPADIGLSLRDYAVLATGVMYDRRPQRPNHRAGHRLHDLPTAGQSTRARRSGWLLLAVAVSAIAAGMGTGRGLVLAAGLALAAAGLHLISTRPMSTHQARNLTQPRDRGHPSPETGAPGPLTVAPWAVTSARPTGAGRPHARPGGRLPFSGAGCLPPVPAGPAGRRAAARALGRRRVGHGRSQCVDRGGGLGQHRRRSGERWRRPGRSGGSWSSPRSSVTVPVDDQAKGTAAGTLGDHGHEMAHFGREQWVPVGT